MEGGILHIYNSTVKGGGKSYGIYLFMNTLYIYVYSCMYRTCTAAQGNRQSFCIYLLYTYIPVYSRHAMFLCMDWAGLGWTGLGWLLVSFFPPSSRPCAARRGSQHPYIHTYTHTHIHTYTHTHIHTYTRTYIHTILNTYMEKCARYI